MRIFRISQRIYKLQLLPIYQAKDRRFPPVMASYGQLGGRAASAAPFGPVVVAGLAARGSAPRPLGLARSVALPAPGFAVWVGLWRAASLLAAAFVVVRPACAGRCLGAGFWRGVVAPGGRRGLSPVLAGCLWDSICAPWPRLRAVAARWGASLCARGQLAAYPGCCLAPPLAAFVLIAVLTEHIFVLTIVLQALPSPPAAEILPLRREVVKGVRAKALPSPLATAHKGPPLTTSPLRSASQSAGAAAPQTNNREVISWSTSTPSAASYTATTMPNARSSPTATSSPPISTTMTQSS